MAVSAGFGAVLLDKDGTLLVDVPYNVDPERMRLADTAASALALLGQLGVPLVVVSNQPGIALGRFGEDALHGVSRRLERLFQRHGARLHGFFYCPHHPAGTVAPFGGGCACRKPAPGLLHQAAAQLGLDLARSWMIGDILDDVEAGHRAGCRAILVDCGNETEWVRGPHRAPDHIVSSLEAAARLVARDLGHAVAGAASCRADHASVAP
jgi:histidinol-phosphate phosphatase family protein